MDKISIVHQLTMKYLEEDRSALSKGPADYAKVYLEIFKSIEGYFDRHDFNAIGEAPDGWRK